MMLKLGVVGYRGMVGSVLFKRMQEEGDFNKMEASFFSTSQVGETSPLGSLVKDAYKLEELLALDVILTTSGSEYTENIYPKLKQAGFKGYFLDAASYLRMNEDAIIILDPVNRKQILAGLKQGIKTFVGGNCTTSLMLLAIQGLLEQNLVEWVSAMTYQAASGAGANNIRELIKQSGVLYQQSKDLIDRANILDLMGQVNTTLNNIDFPCENFLVPLVGNVIPWIDKGLENGQTREEWKVGVESKKILTGLFDTPNIDGLCVRVGTVRSHAQALTIKLKEKNLTINEISAIIEKGNPYISLVANEKNQTLHNLTPLSVSDSLSISVGRVRKLTLGDDYLGLFTVGDQLLWGAAEPLRRMLMLLVEQNV